MHLTQTLYLSTRAEWRTWLRKHHKTEKEIWLVYYNKQSGKRRIPYNDAVEEALCFGWIDSTQKKIDADSFAQRFTPRKPKSPWSELNKERAKKLIATKKMTKAGFAALGNALEQPFTFPPDILKTIKADKATWKYFRQFPESYQRIRISFIAGARKRPEVFKKRLSYFIKMTAQNKTFGITDLTDYTDYTEKKSNCSKTISF
ncbi:MAG: hypothetical protein EPO24_04405 [Bacteroidetes bacterium]|nr:MAG: hypothetical protein EPO24_04405 [Bacteroidota bacterium]